MASLLTFFAPQSPATTASATVLASSDGVYLNPNTGRFWSMDSHQGSSEDPLSLHKYLYCQGNPIMGIDPSGHENMPTMTVNMGVVGTVASENMAVTMAARTTLTSRILQSAALSAFLADAFGLFDHNPQTDVDTLKRKYPDYMVFIHATSTGAWPELIGGGVPTIDPSKGLGKDFGCGFYTFNASSADPRIIPAAVQWANEAASEEGGIPEVTFWLIKRAKYQSLSKADFTALSTLQYSQVVSGFRDEITETTGKNVAFGEIAKRQGGTWVRNNSLPLQYKFEGFSGVSGLKFFGGFSPEPLH